MRNKGYRKYLNGVFLIVVFALTVWSVFGQEDLGEIWGYLQTANIAYILPSIVCVVLFVIGESVVIAYLLRSLGKRVKFRHCCLYSFIGFFYSCITPSASGGQPMQVVAMRKDNIPVAVSTVVLAIVTITYKLVLVVLGLGVMLIQPESVMACLGGWEYLVYLGLALNVGCIVLLLLLVFDPALIRRLANKGIELINRFKPMKHPERLHAKLDNMVQQYTGTAEYYGTHKKIILIVFLITLVQRLILFVVTWFTYRAFGLSGAGFATIILLQAMISVAVDMLPLPGGMGISENLFLEIYLPLFGSELIVPGMVVSRGISYYTQLIISAVMTLVAALVLKKRKKGDAPDE